MTDREEVQALVPEVIRKWNEVADAYPGVTMALNALQGCPGWGEVMRALFDVHAAARASWGLAEPGPLTIAGLVHTAHEAAKAKGWHEGADPSSPVQVLAWLALLHSEVSEAVEDVRRGMMAEDVREDGKPVGLPSELADVLIRLADTCGALGIDLEGAVRRKMAFNATRSHRHGGKVA